MLVRSPLYFRQRPKCSPACMTTCADTFCGKVSLAMLVGLKALPYVVYCPAWSPLASSAKIDRRRRDGEGTQTRGGVVMTFEEVLTQAIAMLQRSGRVSYGALKVQFQLDDDLLELLKDEIVEVHQLARDQEGKMLVWTGDTAAVAPRLPPTPDQAHVPLTYTPPHLAEKILTSRSALEGERKQVTVLF